MVVRVRPRPSVLPCKASAVLYRGCDRTGRTGVNILWLGVIASLVHRFYLSVAACTTVSAAPPLGYTIRLLGHQAAKGQTWVMLKLSYLRHQGQSTSKTLQHYVYNGRQFSFGWQLSFRHGDPVHVRVSHILHSVLTMKHTTRQIMTQVTNTHTCSRARAQAPAHANTHTHTHTHTQRIKLSVISMSLLCRVSRTSKAMPWSTAKVPNSFHAQ